MFNTQANTGVVELLQTTHIVEEGPADSVTGVLLIINLVQVVRELCQNEGSGRLRYSITSSLRPTNSTARIETFRGPESKERQAR